MDSYNEMSNTSVQSQHEEDADLKRGPWTVEEDLLLVNYINAHGEGRWNSLAQSAGLKRTGKSCRLRWLNYLRPNVRRGNMTPEEQLLILELHSRWGNRWSKIAQYLPGRTDNDIKNYWRTRVQKHAKQMKCDVNSQQFRDAMRYLWMPRLMERIQASRLNDFPQQQLEEAPDFNNSTITQNNSSSNQTSLASSPASSSVHAVDHLRMNHHHRVGESSYMATPTHSGSAVSDTATCYCLPEFVPVSTEFVTQVDFPDYNQASSNGLLSTEGWWNPDTAVQSEWSCWDGTNYGGGDLGENLWSSEDILFLQQQLAM